MSNKPRPVRKKKAHRGAAILCRIIGTLILLVVLVAAGSVTVPRFMGYSIFHIVSGSMEPEIPVGSVVYIKPAAAKDVKEGTVIAYNSGDSTVVHRVVKNYNFDGQFITKGDANESEDLSEVNYDQFIGEVIYHLPILGQLLMILMSGVGRIYVICFAACGALLNIVAGRLET